jgi:SAM-dependent methyltransferase
MVEPNEDPALEVRALWNRNADWWDDRLGGGNAFQCELIEPATLRLAGPGPGLRLLDVACGAGRMARLLAARGARVVGVDFCEAFLDRARAWPGPDTLDYRWVDVTDRDQLLALGAGQFDGAVATMALMDIADLDPLFDALPVLLAPGGFFVFSVLHPCFFAPGTEMYAEERLVDGRGHRTRGLKINRYRTAAAFRTEGIRGQPVPSIVFHRSLENLLAGALRRGFRLDALEEPGFATGTDGWFEWQGMPDLAPVLVVRLRL